MAVYHTYVYDGFTRLIHVRDDAVCQNQQNKVVSTRRTGIRCNSAHIKKKQQGTCITNMQFLRFTLLNTS